MTIKSLLKGIMMSAEKNLWFRLLQGKIEKATKESAAFDLFYDGKDDMFIEWGKLHKVPTGVITEFSPSLVVIIKEKSGMALQGFEVHGGVIDADYREEWLVIGRAEYNGYAAATGITLKPGQKIAQFVLVEIPKITFSDFVNQSKIVFKDDKREGGFGSTDVKDDAKDESVFHDLG